MVLAKLEDFANRSGYTAQYRPVNGLSRKLNNAHSIGYLSRRPFITVIGWVKQMFTEYPGASHKGQHYGYGVVISRLKFVRLLYYQGGGVEGFSSSTQRYPGDRHCIFILSNLDSNKP